MKKSRVLSGVLATAMAFSLSITSSAASFCDVSNGHWAYGSIQKLQECGAVSGFGDGSFRPGKKTTRAEFAKCLTGLYSESGDCGINLSDVSENAWYAPCAAEIAAYMPCFVDADQVVSFRPNQAITRMDAVTTILNFFGRFDADEDTTKADVFRDASGMSDEEKLVAANAVSENLINGKNGKFDAQGAMTRAEVCTILARVLAKNWTPTTENSGSFIGNMLQHLTENKKGDVYFLFDLFSGMMKPETPSQPEETPNAPDTETPSQPETPDLETPDTEKPEEQAPQKPSTPDTDHDETVPDTESGSNQSFEKQVLTLVNQERAKAGLSALTWSDELANVARAHSQDMASRKFFSHTNPDGKSPFDRIKAAGISYRTAGENIAAGQRTPQEVMNSWMNSAGHRANILNASFTKLGVGYVTGGSYSTYWTQCFAG